MSDQVNATYSDGNIVPDSPIAWPSGSRVVISLADDQRCFDGSRWPQTAQEIAAWIDEQRKLEPVFESAAELQQFEDFLAESRRQQLALMQSKASELEQLF